MPQRFATCGIRHRLAEFDLEWGFDCTLVLLHFPSSDLFIGNGAICLQLISGCFGSFILACGTFATLMEIWNIWHGLVPRSPGIIKAVTAAYFLGGDRLSRLVPLVAARCCRCRT